MCVCVCEGGWSFRATAVRAGMRGTVRHGAVPIGEGTLAQRTHKLRPPQQAHAKHSRAHVLAGHDLVSEFSPLPRCRQRRCPGQRRFPPKYKLPPGSIAAVRSGLGGGTGGTAHRRCRSNHGHRGTALWPPDPPILVPPTATVTTPGSGASGCTAGLRGGATRHGRSGADCAAQPPCRRHAGHQIQKL